MPSCTHACTHTHPTGLLVLFLWRTLVNIYMNFPLKQCPYLTILFLFTMLLLSQVPRIKSSDWPFVFLFPSSHIHQPCQFHIPNIYGINTLLSIHLLMKTPNHHAGLAYHRRYPPVHGDRPERLACDSQSTWDLLWDFVNEAWETEDLSFFSYRS